MNGAAITSSSRPPQQQHHERVSISGITVHGGSSIINTVENNISNNNGIGSNVSAITIMKSIRKRNTSQRDTTNGAANTSSSRPPQHQKFFFVQILIFLIRVFPLQPPFLYYHPIPSPNPALSSIRIFPLILPCNTCPCIENERV